MFAIPTPYFAERETSKGWKPCKVIGIAANGSSVEPEYIVEYHEAGIAYLARAEYVRKAPPSSRA